jgi:hypothetical protein
MSDQPTDFPYTTTIKHLADEARDSLSTAYGEATLAKWCLIFDKGLSTDPLIEGYEEIADEIEKTKVKFAFKFISVLRILSSNPTTPVTPVALIWLDGHGWGKMSLHLLAELIVKVKEAYEQNE